MGEDTPLTDDYVAELLKKDARFLSERGTGYLSTSSSAAPKHKPNTRFLRNILRDTDAHNAALLAREAEESRARLASLDPKRRTTARRPEQRLYSARARREGTEPDEQRHDRDRTESRRPGEDVQEDTKRRRRSVRHYSRSPEDRYRRRSKDRSHRRRDRDTDERRSKRRSRSPQRSRSPRGSHRDHDKTRHRLRLHSPPHGKVRDQSDDESSTSSYGPRRASRSPPLRSRGRGAHGASSAIDQRFAEEYDPRDDVRPPSADGNGDDWSMALEAMRDRQMWRRTGADRLRAAGFTEVEVAKWEKGDKKDETDVRWAKKGEDREWDRGKTMED